MLRRYSPETISEVPASDRRHVAHMQRQYNLGILLDGAGRGRRVVPPFSGSARLVFGPCIDHMRQDSRVLWTAGLRLEEDNGTDCPIFLNEIMIIEDHIRWGEAEARRQGEGKTVEC